jgi:hypothetical protein
MRTRLTILSLLIGTTYIASAAVVTETEADGTAVNNSVATAQAIPTSAFTLPVPGTVFNPPGFSTATIQGSNGLDDVDFFQFDTLGGRIYLDMDNIPATFDPIVALFNSAGTLIAYGDDSELDNGSENTIDSFVGIFNLPAAGIYYVGVSENANFPTTALTGTETPLVRPNGGFGGFAVSGVAAGVSTYDFNDVQPGGALYTLHVSVQAIPEPSSFVLMGGAALVLFLAKIKQAQAR